MMRELSRIADRGEPEEQPTLDLPYIWPGMAIEEYIQGILPEITSYSIPAIHVRHVGRVLECQCRSSKIFLQYPVQLLFLEAIQIEGLKG